MTQFAKHVVMCSRGVLILFLTACASLPAQIPTTSVTNIPTETSGVPVTGGDLANTQWVLVSFDESGTETPAIRGTTVFLELRENGEAGGSGGCNTFGTQYDIQDGTISFDQIASTKMACTAQGVTEQEQKFFSALQSADRYKRSGESLRIWYSNGQNILNFSGMSAGTPVQPTSPAALTPTIVEPTIVNPTVPSVGGNTPQPIKFAAGSTSATVTGHLASSESDQYVLRASAGQTMSLDLTFTGGQAILVVWGEDGDVLLSDHAEAASFQRELPTTQDYFIQVKGRPEGSTDYSLVVTVPAISTGMEHIEFPSGSTSATVTGQLNATGSHQYILQASAGQTMSIDMTFTEGMAILAVWGADGNVLLSDHAQASSFEGVLPTTQEYNILVKGRPDGSTTYRMTVTIPPAP